MAKAKALPKPPPTYEESMAAISRMFEKKLYPNTRKEMFEHFAITLSDYQLEKFAKKSKVTKRDLKDDICDTIDRDYLIDAVVVYVLGEDYHWPLNMDELEYSMDFYPRFYVEAQKKGIEVLPGVILHFSKKAKNL